MQALSEEDRRLWMEAMDGREPVSRNVGAEVLEESMEALCSLGQLAGHKAGSHAAPAGRHGSCIVGRAPAERIA